MKNRTLFKAALLALIISHLPSTIYQLAAQQVTIPAVETNVYDLLSGNDRTVTNPDPLVFNQTWNDGSDTFDGFYLSITDTASAAGSRTIGAILDASYVWYFQKDGTLFTATGFDGIGAVDLDFGSADITDFTFTTDGTGTAEFVVPDGSIDTDEILDGTIAGADLADADLGQVSVASGVLTVEGHTRFIEKHATSHTLTAAECYGAVYYITASGVTLTLPAAADGMSLRVICTTANVGIVDANASDLIILDGTALDDGDSIDSAGAAGDVIDLYYYDATGWFGVSISGAWVDGGAS